MFSLSLYLLLLALFDICWAQQYYCVTGQFANNQLNCPPKQNSQQNLEPFSAIQRCCSTIQTDIPPTLKKQIFDSRPPVELPNNCDLALTRGPNQFVCIPIKPNAFIKWHASVKSLNDIAICCGAKPTENDISIFDAQSAMSPANVEVEDRPSTSIPGQPPSIQTLTTRRPFRPFIPFRPSRISSAFCRDLSIPGRPFDCAVNADRCIDPLYSSLMAQQCPFTCNLCGRLRQQNPFGGGVIDRHIGGGRRCRDWIPPSGHMSCQQMVANLYCQNHRTQMIAQCPVSCGFCTSSF